MRFGIDLGGTKTEGVILDAGGREIWRERTPTDASRYDAVLDGIERLYRRMAAAAAEGAPHTLGIGTPGAVSRRTGLLKNSNTTCLNGMPFARDLREPASAASSRSRTTPTASPSRRPSRAPAEATGSCSA